MKIAIFTSNGIRHKYVANNLAKLADSSLIISECVQNDATNISEGVISPIAKHFALRYETEKQYFKNNDYFKFPTLPILYKEINLEYTYEIIKKFNPDLSFVFGSYIIKNPLLKLLSSSKIINLHLGLSPYYRGSGTNFWPFVNEELEYVGSTILHLDSGVDTGDIICHVRPKFEVNDNVHTIGCKVIKESLQYLIKILEIVRRGKELNRIKQWKVTNERYYKTTDFTEDVLVKYQKNLAEGLIEKFINSKQKQLRLISLE